MGSWGWGGSNEEKKQNKKKLNHLPFTTQFFAIQLVHGVVGISVVIKLLWTHNGVKPFNDTGRNLTGDADESVALTTKPNPFFRLISRM